MTCPTCGRRPSERISSHGSHCESDPCPDSIHDLADEASTLKARVEELEADLGRLKADRPAEPADADDFPEEAWKEWVREWETEHVSPESTYFGGPPIMVAARWAWTEALLYSDRRLPVWVDELVAERDAALEALKVSEAMNGGHRALYVARTRELDAALERVKELERRNYTLSDDKDEAEEDAEALEADRDTARADLAEAVALVGRFEGAHHPECTHHDCQRRRMAAAFLAKHAKGGE